MKNIFYNLIIVLCSFHAVNAQECHDALLNYLNSTEINKLHVGTSFDLEGSTIEEKGESFILTMAIALSEKTGATVTYEPRVLNVNQSTYMIYDQYVDGELVEGSGLILGFDNNGNLSSFNHLGATTMDDVGMVVRENTTIQEIRISNKENARLLKNLGVPVPGHIHIDFPSHSYDYDCSQGINGLTEVGVGGASGSITSSRLTMVKFGPSGSETYAISDCDNTIVSVPSASSFEIDNDNYLVCPEDPTTVENGKFEYAMSYYHLTELSEYFKTSPCASEVGELGLVAFNPYNLGGSTTYQFGLSSGTNIVMFGATNPPAGSYHDLAEDAHMVIQGGMHYWYKYNSPFMFPNETNSGDGMLYGYLDYFTYAYTSSHPNFGGGQTEFLMWGENGSNSRGLSVDPTETYPDYLANFGNTDFQKKGQLLGTALYEISEHDLLGKAIADELAFKSLSLLNSASTQVTAAMAIIQKAHDIGLSNYQICALETILANRYPNDIVSSEMYDFYIQDETWDTGVEGSEAARHYVSPDIWNRHDNDQIYEHENPIHNDDEDNYLYVRLRDRECGIPNGKLKVYFSESSTSHAWPSDWNNPAPTQDNYTYFIDEVDLDDFIDTWQDPVTDEDVFLYEIPWVPYDPTDFGFDDGAQVHGCLLIRIDAPVDDPMFNEVPGSNVKHNIKVNNNIGSINTTVIHVSSAPFAPPIINKHRLLVRHYALNGSAKQTGTVNDQLVIEVMPSPGHNANAILDYGNVEIELSAPLLEAWRKGGSLSKGLRFLPPNKIICTGTYSVIDNILLELIEKYPINVSFNQTRALDFPIEFHVNLETENGCNVGGEKYILTPVKRPSTGGNGEKEEKYEDLEQRNAFNETRIYPNPAALAIEVVAESAIQSFDVNDASGKLIRNIKHTLLDGEIIKIDLTAFKAGVYYINIQFENGKSEVHKFVKI